MMPALNNGGTVVVRRRNERFARAAAASLLLLAVLVIFRILNWWATDNWHHLLSPAQACVVFNKSLQQALHLCCACRGSCVRDASGQLRLLIGRLETGLLHRLTKCSPIKKITSNIVVAVTRGSDIRLVSSMVIQNWRIKDQVAVIADDNEFSSC